MSSGWRVAALRSGAAAAAAAVPCGRSRGCRACSDVENQQMSQCNLRQLLRAAAGQLLSAAWETVCVERIPTQDCNVCKSSLAAGGTVVLLSEKV